MDINLNILSFLVGIISLIVTLIIFRSQILKKLNYLIDNLVYKKNPPLSLLQAKSLAHIYLTAVQQGLQVMLHDFINNKLEKDTLDGALNFILKTTNDVITNNRFNVAPFNIADDKNFKEFLEEVNPITGKTIDSAKHKAEIHFKKYYNKEMDANELYSASLLLVGKAIHKSEDILYKELDTRYTIVK